MVLSKKISLFDKKKCRLTSKWTDCQWSIGLIRNCLALIAAVSSILLGTKQPSTSETFHESPNLS